MIGIDREFPKLIPWYSCFQADSAVSKSMGMFPSYFLTQCHSDIIEIIYILGTKPASSGFSFGSSSSGSSSAAFTFAPTATGSSAATSSTAPSTTKEDEEYVPPVAETKEFDDAKDALYQKKSKIFYLKDGNYKEIGNFYNYVIAIIT